MQRNTIRKIYAYFAAIFAVVLVCLVIVASCGPYNSGYIRQSAPEARSTPPVDAFVIVKVDSKVKPEKCEPLTKNCEKIIKELPPIESRKTGSGMMVWHEGRSFILTAAHVCDEEAPTHFK